MRTFPTKYPKAREIKTVITGTRIQIQWSRMKCRYRFCLCKSLTWAKVGTHGKCQEKTDSLVSGVEIWLSILHYSHK
jgi:hypothetical protein